MLFVSGIIGYNTYNLYTHQLRHKTLPVTFYVSKDAPSEGIGASIIAAEFWNRAMGKRVIEIIVTDISPITYLGHRNLRNDISFTNNQRAQSHVDVLGYLAAFSDIKRPGYFLETDVVIIDFIRSYSLREKCYKPGEVEKFPLIWVLVHEMGHGLGLGHYLGNSVMVPTVQYRIPMPSAMDIERVKDRYPEYF